MNLQDEFDQSLSRGLTPARGNVEDPFAHQPRSFLFVRAVVEHAGCPQSRCRCHNSVQDAQLQPDPVSTQLEGMIHLLDDELGVIKDLDHDTVRAPPQLNRAWCRLYTSRV